MSTSPNLVLRGHRQGSRVASSDDIHTAVENHANNSHNDGNKDKTGRKPPGQFISDELEEQTARFIENVKGLARRRKANQTEEGPGPPPRSRAQRSSRR